MICALWLTIVVETSWTDSLRKNRTCRQLNPALDQNCRIANLTAAEASRLSCSFMQVLDVGGSLCLTLARTLGLQELLWCPCQVHAGSAESLKVGCICCTPRSSCTLPVPSSPAGQWAEGRGSQNDRYSHLLPSLLLIYSLFIHLGLGSGQRAPIQPPSDSPMPECSCYVGFNP